MGIVSIAWGTRVSDVFLDRVKWIVDDLDIGYSLEDGCSKLMACIAWESNETFSAGVRNMAGSGATGLIQFMPSIAVALGTTTAKLAQMTPEDQLNYVWKYFEPYRGRLKTLGDVYMAILWPKGVGKSETYVLWDKHSRPTTYRQNSGLDVDKNGVITKAEATAKVSEKLSKGMSPGNVLESLVLDNGVDKDVTQEPEDTTPEQDTAIYVDKTEPQQEPEYMGDTAPAKPKLDTVRDAAESWSGKLLGILIILGSLLANPDFAAKLGGFTVAVARGEASWSALASLIGIGLLAYRRTYRG